MGAGDKSNVWHLILHATQTITPGTVREFCQNNEDVKLCSFETADEDVKRDHYHIAVVGTDIVRSTLQRKLKAHFKDIKGNTDYTTHLPKKDETVGDLYLYICKGKKQYKPHEMLEGRPGPAIIYATPMINTAECQNTFHLNQEKYKSEMKKLAEKRASESVKAKHKVIEQLIQVYKEFDVNQNTARHIHNDARRMYKGDIDSRTLLAIINAVLWSINSADADLVSWRTIENKIFG